MDSIFDSCLFYLNAVCVLSLSSILGISLLNAIAGQVNIHRTNIHLIFISGKRFVKKASFISLSIERKSSRGHTFANIQEGIRIIASKLNVQ